MRWQSFWEHSFKLYQYYNTIQILGLGLGKPVLGFARETEPVEGVCVDIHMCLYAYKDWFILRSQLMWCWGPASQKLREKVDVGLEAEILPLWEDLSLLS